MSRFFATNSDSESDSDVSVQDVAVKPTIISKTYQVSDEDEETKRVVRSGKDKTHDELRNILKLMRNHKKIKDMSKVLSDFEDLTKAFDKAKKVIDKDGVPRFYLRALAELEDFVNMHWEDTEGRKAMSKTNSKGLTSLRQKVKRNNKLLETELTSYRENPDIGSSGEEEAKSDKESDSDDDDDVDFAKRPPGAAAAKEPSAAKDKGEESDSDDSWVGQSDSDSSSSDDEGRPMGQLTADFFRKKVPAEGDGEPKKRKEKEEKEKKRKERKTKADEESDAEKDDADGWTKVKGGEIAAVEKPKMFSNDVEINHDVVFKKLNELVSARGKKGTDRNVQIEMLMELREIAKAHSLGDATDCKMIFSIISAVFDYNPNIATSMKEEMWEKCLAYIQELTATLIANKNTIILRDYVDEEAENNFTGEPPYRIRGCLLTIIERMDDEFTKMLQACDAHSTEYIIRLKDETVVCKLIEDLEVYMKSQKSTTDEDLCRVYLKRIQHMYYKFDAASRIAPPAAPAVKSADDTTVTVVVDGTPAPSTTATPAESQAAIMERLCKFIYTKDNTDRIRTRTILSHIYHHALHDRWFQARDLMLMSHLQDTVQHSDIPTQILYNRALVQLGICAFRQGFISQAHNCLVDIQSSGRAKELLAQGLLLQRMHERTPEQEKIEKRRQMPYHMHINLELLECVYLVSAMLLEMPYMAAHEFDTRRRMISKNFHHVLRVSERQTLVGPPESMREHIVAACKAMKVGDWKNCCNYIINEKMNAKVWDLFYDANRVREMLRQKIQEESLRTYLFSFSSVYDSISLKILAQMFELDNAIILSTISKMIITEELMASLDEPTQTVMMHRTEPTRLQSLALQLSEKVASLVEYNERTLEMKTTGPSYFNYQRQTGNQERGGTGGGGGYQQREGQYEGGQQRSNYQGRRGRGGGQRGGRDHYEGGGREGGGGGGRYNNQYNNRQQGGNNYYHQYSNNAE